MSEKLLQEQITEINKKLDLILDEATIQRQNREAVSDLIDDVAVISKDAFKNMVVKLDYAGIEMDSEALVCLVIHLVRNIRSMGMAVDLIESLTDLAKDVTPIVKQIGLDGISKFHDLEQKGYFEVLDQLGKSMDKILSRYSVEEIRNMTDNLVQVVDTIINIADPKLLDKINIAANALKDINPEEIEDYSLFRMLRQMNKPEVKKSMGFMMAFLQNISKTQNSTNK